MPNRFVVCLAEEVQPGERLAVEVGGHPLVVFNVDGNYTALLDRCPHQGARMSGGLLASKVRSRMPGEYDLEACPGVIRCPWHGWEFDIRTGRSVCDPDRSRVRPYRVTSEPGDQIDAPLAATVVPLAVHASYLIAEI